MYGTLCSSRIEVLYKHRYSHIHTVLYHTLLYIPYNTNMVMWIIPLCVCMYGVWYVCMVCIWYVCVCYVCYMYICSVICIVYVCICVLCYMYSIYVCYVCYVCIAVECRVYVYGMYVYRCMYMVYMHNTIE